MIRWILESNAEASYLSYFDSTIRTSKRSGPTIWKLYIWWWWWWWPWPTETHSDIRKDHPGQWRTQEKKDLRMEKNSYSQWNRDRDSELPLECRWGNWTFHADTELRWQGKKRNYVSADLNIDIKFTVLEAINKTAIEQYSQKNDERFLKSDGFYHHKHKPAESSSFVRWKVTFHPPKDSEILRQ